VVFISVLVAGLFHFFLYRDQLSETLFRDIYSRLRYSFGSHSDEVAETFSYDDYMLSRFASFQNGLVLLSGDRLVVYGGSGDEKYGVDCGFARPALAVSDRMVLAYDRGGRSFVLTDNNSTIMDGEWGDVLYTVCMNDDGAFALISGERGYASVCTVFDDRQREKFIWKSGSHYILDAALSPSAGLLTLVSCEGGGDQLNGRVTFLDTGSEENPIAVHELPGTMPWGVGFLEGTFCFVVTDDSALIFSLAGQLLAEWRFEDRELLSFCAGDNFLALALSGQRDGGGELAFLDGAGFYGKTSYSGHLLSLSAAGKWVGLLTDGAVSVYGADTEPCGQPMSAADAKAVLMRSDGAALLLASNTATVFTPSTG